MTKLMGVMLGIAVLSGCAATPGGGESQGGAATKVAVANCMSKADADKLTCEKGCPAATGNEHFSVQHKIAREQLACKETCGTTHAQAATQCSATR